MPRWLVVVALAGCECGKQPKAPAVSAGSAIAIDAAARVDLASRYAELRDQRALRCLLDRNEKPNTLNPVLESLAESADPVVVRAAAFALVEEARPNGESVELAALAEAVHVLGPIGDVEGLKLAFARIDELGMPATLLDDDETYRARIARDLPAAQRSRARLAWVTQTAMGGDIPAASKIYDTELEPDDRRPTPAHVAALVALGRDAKVHELVESAVPLMRGQLVDTWLMTAAQLRKPLGDATSAMIVEIDRDPRQLYPRRETMRAMHRSGDAAATARLRAVLAKRVTPELAKELPGLVEERYLEVLESGTHSERAAIEPFVEPRLRAREQALRSGSFDDALAEAFANRYPDLYLARVWARAVAEGADAAFWRRFEAKVCERPPPVVVTPALAQPGLELVVTSKLRAREQECERRDLIVRLTNGEAVLDEEIYEGSCDGACTAAAKREGRRELQGIEKRIAKGEGSESELDYDFTGCLFSGHLPGRVERVGDRQVAIFAEKSIGAHSTEHTSHLLAFEVCGELFVSQAFGYRYTGGWPLTELHVEQSPDKREIRVRAQNEYWRGFVYRAALPECPGSPIETVNASDY